MLITNCKIIFVRKMLLSVVLPGKVQVTSALARYPEGQTPSRGGVFSSLLLAGCGFVAAGMRPGISMKDTGGEGEGESQKRGIGEIRRPWYEYVMWTLSLPADLGSLSLSLPSTRAPSTSKHNTYNLPADSTVSQRGSTACYTNQWCIVVYL